MTTQVRDPGGELAEPLGSHQEEWRPIPDYPGYEVSSLGRVKSWKKYHGSSSRIRLQQVDDDGYLVIRLSRGRAGARQFKAHRLVLEAFVGPRPEGMVTRHLDGDPTNNRLSNLRYGTPAENVADQVAHGTHAMANKTECRYGHPFTPENTYLHPRKSGGVHRRCRTCRSSQRRARRKSHPA